MRPDALRPWRRAVLIALGIIALVWIAAVARAVSQATNNLDRGRTQIEDAQQSLTLEAIVDGSASRDLRAASTHFSAAEDHLRSPLLAPGRFIPILGRQLRSVTSIADSASDLLADGASLSEELGRLDTRTAEGRLAVLEVLSTSAVEFEQAVASVDLGPSDGLISRLGSVRADVEGRLDELRGNLERVTRASRGLSSLARGPSRILVLASSNAEMRVGQGAVLQYGVVEIADGSIRSSHFDRVGALGTLPAGFADPDVAANWGWVGPPSLQFVGLTTRFDAVARNAAGMVAKVTGHSFDAVVQIDAVAITKLVSLTGPVDTVVAGQPITGLADDALLRHLLVGQYAGVPAVDGDQENAERREALSGMANEAIVRIERGQADIGRTAEVLAAMVRGRHIHFFSERPEVQAAFDSLGAGTGLPSDLFSLALFNAGSNKLDPYVKVDADIQMTEHPDRTAVRVTTTIRNETSTDAPPYVLGQTPPGAPPFAYSAMLTFTVPGNARGLWFDDGVPVSVLGKDGPHQVISALVVVPRRSPLVRTLTFELPPGSGLTIIPSSRWPEVQWNAEGRHYGDDESHAIGE